MVREIRGAEINPKSSFKNYGAQNMWGWKLHKQIQYYNYYYYTSCNRTLKFEQEQITSKVTGE
jgi:hypothetical protein